jgi:flagellar motor switch protein FliM
MSQDFLSQEEVDALLKGVSGEPEEAAVEETTGGVKPYDLGRQERIVRGRMPTLELINERFARLLRIGLFNFIHKGTEISVGPIKVQKYSEFIRNLVVPTNLNLVTIKPLRGTALVVIDPNLVFLVVDSMFGGDGRFHTRVEGRDFTPTEQRIIQGLLNVIFAEYEKAWKPVFEINFDYIRSEMNTQFANIATPSEIVVAITFTVELGGNSSEMHFCIPYCCTAPCTANRRAPTGAGPACWCASCNSPKSSWWYRSPHATFRSAGSQNLKWATSFQSTLMNTSRRRSTAFPSWTAAMASGAASTR